jgi:hypothetical protein
MTGVRCDLVQVSKSLSKPWFCNVWRGLYDESMLANDTSAGIGFRKLRFSGAGLPPEAAAILVRLSAVDRAAARCGGGDEEQAHIRDVISDSHHQLMSLSPWRDLPGEGQPSSSEVIYEVSRLTAILYSNSVLLQIPVTNGWHLQLLRQLRMQLDAAPVGLWTEGNIQLLVWCLEIASIAARDSDQSEYFVAYLRLILIGQSVSTWAALEETLRMFLWTNSACGDAGRTVFDALRIDKQYCCVERQQVDTSRAITFL